MTPSVEKVIEILRKVVPPLNPPVEEMIKIQEGDHYRALVCGILSARSRDEKTIPVCRKLFEKYPTAEDLAKAPLSDIEETIRGIGLYRQKAKYLKSAVQKLVEEYNGKLPRSLKELTQFPGVGRKIANILLLHVYGEDTIAVDTHVHRIANLLGLVNTKTPLETELKLKEITPKRLWKEVNYLLVGFGQTICDPKRPKCDICPLKVYCKGVSNGNSKNRAV
jgi:endonuclease-3